MFNKFDEFLNCYNILGKQSDVQLFFQFCAGLRIDVKLELCKREITELKEAYALVQDLDILKLSHAFRRQKHEAPTFKSTSCQYPHQVHAQRPAYKVDTNDKSAESNAKDKNTKRDFSTLSHIIKCYKYQAYGHVALSVQPRLELLSINCL